MPGDPRLGELVAFRKVLDSIPPDVAMDEAFVEALVIQRGLQVRYAPDAVVYNMGPTRSAISCASAAATTPGTSTSTQVWLQGVQPTQTQGGAHCFP